MVYETNRPYKTAALNGTLAPILWGTADYFHSFDPIIIIETVDLLLNMIFVNSQQPSFAA